jgi:hypothetical protein
MTAILCAGGPEEGGASRWTRKCRIHSEPPIPREQFT